MNIDDRVQSIVFTGQQYFRFDAIDKVLSLAKLRREIVNDRLTFARKLDQSLRVVELACYLTIEFKALFEAGALL
jgi:hypothetical protein